MTTVLETPRTRRKSQRLLTVEDFAALLERLPSGQGKYELDHGELVVMAPPGHWHGNQQSNVLRFLHRVADATGGRAIGEAMIVLARNPAVLLAPDAYFLTADQLPVQRSREGYCETIPKVVVEIRCKNDSVREVTDKLGEYLAAGVVEAWLIDPFRQVMEIHTAEGVRSFGPGDTVLSAALPAFAAPVAELIAE